RSERDKADMSLKRINSAVRRRLKLERFKPEHIGTAILAARSSENYIYVRWFDNPNTTRGNWGDALNPILVSKLTSRQVVNETVVCNPSGLPVFSVIGSVLDNSETPRLQVWGSGLISSEGKPKLAPERVFAVRG